MDIDKVLTKLNDATNIINAEVSKQRADIRYSSDVNPFSVQRVVLDLSVAATEGRPYRLDIPLSAIHVPDATDLSTKIRASVNSDSIMQLQNYIELKRNDGIEFDRRLKGLFLTWDAQPGKSITLNLYIDLKFKSGSQISVTSGGLSLSFGDTIETLETATVGTAAAEMFASDADRKKMVVKNLGPGTIYLGSAVVTTSAGSYVGLPVAPGESVVFDSTSGCYAVSTTAATKVSLTKFS